MHASLVDAEVWQEVMVTGTTSRGTQTEVETSDDLSITQIHASQQEVSWSCCTCLCVCVHACMLASMHLQMCTCTCL